MYIKGTGPIKLHSESLFHFAKKKETKPTAMRKNRIPELAPFLNYYSVQRTLLSSLHISIFFWINSRDASVRFAIKPKAIDTGIVVLFLWALHQYFDCTDQIYAVCSSAKKRDSESAVVQIFNGSKNFRQTVETHSNLRIH